MSTNRKYDFEVTQTGDGWLAKVTRKVNSKKRVATEEKTGFTSEAEAIEWAESVLEKLVEKQRQSNETQLKKRKEIQAIKSQRSARRASKTEKAKSEAAKTLYSDAEPIEE